MEIQGRQVLKKATSCYLTLVSLLMDTRSDITRTFIYQEASDQQKDIYQTVLKAEMAALEME
ncbi:M24 family metallopeptidase [Bacillus sp. SL00103]